MERIVLLRLAGLVLLYLLAGSVALTCIARGFRKLDLSFWRALGWWFGGVCALMFIALLSVSLRFAEPEPGTRLVYQEVVRGGALLSGLVALLYGLSALLPVTLDFLERRSFASFMSARLIRATKSGFLTVISVLSILGVAFSSCALCTVTSVMGGFGYDLKRKILGNTAHIVVDVVRPGGFSGHREVFAAVERVVKPLGGALTPVVGGEAMASSSTNRAGAVVRGIDPATIGDVIMLPQNVEVGRFEYLSRPDKLVDLPANEVIGRGPNGEPYLKGPGLSFPKDLDPDLAKELRRKPDIHPGIVVGRELAKSLHVMVGDELTLLSPLGELGPTGIMPRARKFRVAGIFYSGMYEYDASHAYVLVEVAQKLFEMQGKVSTIDVRVADPENVAPVRMAIESALGEVNAAREKRQNAPPVRVRDWQLMNKNLFSALKLEKIATFIILSLTITVASFCIICTLLLMVHEKAKEIAVLKALGAADGAVMRVFVQEGVIIGAIGTVLGVSWALAQCYGLSWVGIRLDPDVYYIDRLPVNVDPADYSMVAVAAMVICTLATIYPAFTAARVQPVDGLRYE